MGALLPANIALAQNSSMLLWGDTHLHTSYSFDAFLNQNQSADPDTAYRWAKGLPVIHPYNRSRVQIETPLDFLVVADHAELMGVIRAIENDTDELGSAGFFNDIKRWINTYFLLNAIEDESGQDIFIKILPQAPSNRGGDPVADPANELAIGSFGDTVKTETTAWHEIVDAAERHNQPGKFTSMIGWEWSSIPTGANLHRVVITPDGGDKAKQFLPFGSDESQYPEDLWAWLEQTQANTGARFLAIPHNSNISKGYMFAETNLKGQPITPEYARRRISWEPLAEITQIKGDSETHPLLSPDDEFADFETYQFYIQQTHEDYKVHKGDYVRSALLRGLELEQNVGVNPYKFGLIGSTDAHTGLASAEENNFWGKMARDSTPETKRSRLVREGGKSASGWNMAAEGLAAVWVSRNTREEIFAAFKRKEVYATTGPRIAIRVFAGWDFSESAVNAKDIAEIGYARGVPMGGDLTQASTAGATPQLLIRAVKDPRGANLDRLQVVKGWIAADGQAREKIFNVAWSGERELDTYGNLTAVGNTVDESTAHYRNSIGSPEFSVLWTDPEFDPGRRAFYYVRVLQIPTPRHSLYDAVALQAELPEEGPAAIQERAYTSPIWYTP
ncbi:MAG: DUF3604 domain-containing protein [Gammaproteobacteria bacterium]|nr:DUF3604 domain-containing protein [Gammaproteobacteria bacterium]